MRDISDLWFLCASKILDTVMNFPIQKGVRDCRENNPVTLKVHKLLLILNPAIFINQWICCFCLPFYSIPQLYVSISLLRVEQIPFFCFVIWLLIHVCSIQVYLYGAHVTSWKNDHGEELLFVSNKVLLKFLHGFFGSTKSFSFLWYAAFLAFKFVTLRVMKDIW